MNREHLAGAQAARPEKTGSDAESRVNPANMEQPAPSRPEAPSSRAERPPVREAKERADAVKKRLEYRDAEGRSLGRAAVELGQEVITSGYGEEAVRMVELLSLKVEGFRRGKPTSIDVLELARAAGIRILVPAPGETKRRRVYDTGEQYVATDLPDNPVALGTLLHELGHANQFREERFSSLDRVATAGRVLYDQPGVDWEKLGPAVREVVEKVPDVGKAYSLTPEVLADIDTAFDLLKGASRRFEDARKMEEAGVDIGDEATLGRLRSAREEAEAEAQRAKARFDNLILMSGAKQSVYVANQILERDATRRAFEWMREIKKETGVDVLAETRIKREPASDVCETSMVAEAEAGQETLPEWSVTDYVTHAREKLATYGADRRRLGKSDVSPGVIPAPGSNRLRETPEPAILKATRDTAVGRETQNVSPDAAPTESPRPKKGFFARLFGGR